MEQNNNIDNCIEKVKNKYPKLFIPVLKHEDIEKMNREQLIDAICKHHPGKGTTAGYSWYIGGMADTGEWLPEKMRYMHRYEDDVYRVFLLKLEQEQEKWNQSYIDRYVEECRLSTLPVEEAKAIRDKRYIEQTEKEKQAWNKIAQDIENYLMWGK